LFDTYKEQITPQQVGIVLKEQASAIYYDENVRLITEKLLSAYPNLPPEALVPFMTEAAWCHTELFECFFEKFPQLEAQHLQNILNKAVYVYGDRTWFGDGSKRVVELIKNKFPQMEAIHPFLKPF